MAPPAEPMSDRLARVRDAMRRAGVDALIVPSEDPHNSEMPPACFKRREWVSGFTGSAGCAVVTAHGHAALWTDGRYFLQAGRELTEDWELVKSGTPGAPEIPDWLQAKLPAGAAVGYDPDVHSAKAAEELEAALRDRSLAPSALRASVIDECWGGERPPLPGGPVRVHPIEYAGEGVASKLQRVKEQLRAAGAGALVCPALDEVAWLFNLRGEDVEATTVFLSSALVLAPDGSDPAAVLFADEAKLSEGAAAQLREAGVAVKPYDALAAEVEAVAARGEALWADPATVSATVAKAVAAGAARAGDPRGKGGRRGGGGKRRKVEAGAAAAPDTPPPAVPKGLTRSGAMIAGLSPVVNFKACKNPAELAGMREAHLRDGEVMARFWCWLETEVAAGRTHTEAAAARHLESLRHQQPGYLGVSFDTILGEGPNGAIIHHRASEGREVGKGSCVLLDAGAQFDCGTTDATRTHWFEGEAPPPARLKECYTRVLMGHIALDSAVFPEGVPGFVLDSYARGPLWRAGLDYRHGTGHGVGAALHCHEGPCSISQRFGITAPIAAGMVVSNEPGYYEDGSFGVRIENLQVVGEADTANRYGGVTFLGFSRLTRIPIQRALIDYALLSESDVEWIDAYHNDVWADVSPRLDGEALEWLRRSTAPLPLPAAA